MKYYYQSVGYGEVLLLNANPNTDGLIPEDDMKRYYEFGAEIDRRFGHPIEGKLTVKPNGAEVQFDQMQPVNHVQIREDIVFGQRIRKFEIDAHTADGWKTVYSGVTVGNRHIAVFDTVEADAVRVDVLETAGIPKIMDLTAHNVTGVDIPKLIEVLSAPNYVHDGLRKQLCTMTVAKAKEALARGALLFDLSEHITMPGQYRFAMECEGDHMKAKDVIPYMDGNAAPEMAAWQGVNAVINRTGVVIDGSTTKVSFTFDIDPKWSDDAVIYWFITRM